MIDLDPAPVTAVITHPDNANDNLSYDIPLPVWDVGTVGGERIALIEEAVAIMLSTQLDEAFQQGELDADFAPGFNSFAINRGLRYYGTNLQGPDLGGLLEQFQSHLLRAAVTGFTADDVQRAQDQLLGALDEELAGLDSKQDWQYASELMGYFLEGSGLDGTASRVARQRAVVESFDVEERTDFWRWLVGASGPVVVSIGSEAADVPSADELEAIIEEARPAEVGGAAQAIDELIATPDAAEITDESTRRTPEGDVTTWTFANGVQVSHQQSDIQAGQFFVAMESDGGWSTLDEPDASIAQAAVSAVIQSGVGDHDAATVARYLESRDLGLDVALEETAETLFGASATSDAEDLFALIHVTMTQPRVDDVALRSVGRQAETALEFLESNPVVQAETVLLELLVDGDDRYDTFLRAGDIDALDGDELLGVFATRFGTVDDLVVAIVGDIPALAARDLAARYLGTLPVGEADSWVDLGIDAPTEARRANIELTDGTANGGITRFDVVLADPTARDTVNTEFLSTIITNRITDVIREELGASYGGVAAVVVDRSGAGFISSYIEVDGDPARLDEIHGALDSMLAELSTAGPSADEFDRAVTLLTNDYDFIDNFLFIDTNLELLLHPGADVLLPEDRFAVLSGLSRDDVRALAATLYGDEGSVEVWKVLP
ncbi:MAG: insulinase family protein [Acidimicrobiales bacterium]|nr:insulinase family protein [Acidimicrobiales bacterium]